MKTKTRYILLTLPLAAIFISLSFTRKAEPDYNGRELVAKVFESIENVKTLRYNLQCNERINGRIQHTESQVKLQVAPRKLYLSLKGPEVLWISGKNNGNALVNPGAFPYINLNLDPYGSLMRKDQ